MSLNIQSIPYPEYTTIERDALTNLHKGFKIFNSDDSEFQIYDGLSWSSFGGGAALTYKIESASGNSFVSFENTGTDEFATIKGTDGTRILKILSSTNADAVTIDNTRHVQLHDTLTVGTLLPPFSGLYEFVVNGPNGGINLNRDHATNPALLRMTNNTSGSGGQIRVIPAGGLVFTDESSVTPWINVNNTGVTLLSGRALYLTDSNTYILRDGSNNLTFADSVTGVKTLAELLAGTIPNRIENTAGTSYTEYGTGGNDTFLTIKTTATSSDPVLRILDNSSSTIFNIDAVGRTYVYNNLTIADGFKIKGTDVYSLIDFLGGWGMALHYRGGTGTSAFTIRSATAGTEQIYLDNSGLSLFRGPSIARAKLDVGGDLFLDDTFYIGDINTHLALSGTPAQLTFTDATTGSKTLAELAAGGSSYILPVADTGVLGGILDGTDLTIDASGNVTVSNYTHTHSAYDNSTALTTASVYSNISVTNGIVTGLTTRNLTLANLGYTGATNANYYTHPSYNGDDFSIDTGLLSGATVVSDVDINVTTDTGGHVTDANATIATRNLTLANLGYTGATNANYYTHPTFAGDDINIDTGALSGATVVSDIDINLTTGTDGHIVDANGVVATRTLTAANIGAATTSHTHTITDDNSATWYDVMGHSGTTMYGVSGVEIQGSTNNIRAADFVLASDRRLKDNINYNIEHITLDGLKTVSFNLNGQFNYGFIAQDMLETHPEIVLGTGKEKENGDIDYYSIKQNSILAITVKEVQTLKSENLILKTKVDDLESRLLFLEQLLTN